MSAVTRPALAARLLLLGVLAPIAPSVAAQPGSGAGPAAACTSVVDDRERLACYDKSAQAVKKPGPRPKSHQPPPPELETLLDDVNRRIDDRTKAVCRGC